MKQISYVLLSVFSVSLSACTEGGGRAVPGSAEWFASNSPQVIASYYEGVCRTGGFVAGTDAMSRCIAAEIEKAQARNAATATTV